jgi:hypothetical protein
MHACTHPIGCIGKSAHWSGGPISEPGGGQEWPTQTGRPDKSLSAGRVRKDKRTRTEQASVPENHAI